eukprot:GHVO01005154.1.p1 GENE.GHVO01005154.1~~GHVO01005154.1.p1  ORF type:complete len:635 (+),score=100.42 GHVO01005154.1:251-1906(+)
MAVVASAFGVFVACVAYLWLRVARNSVAQVTGMIGCIYWTCWAAEHYLHSSGIIATVSFGIAFGSFGKPAFTRDARKMFGYFLKTAASLLNQVVFVTAGVLSMRFLREYNISYIMIPKLLLLYIAFLGCRAIVVLTLMPLMRHLGYGVNWKEAVVLWYGGLRGGVTLALALILEANEDIPMDVRGAAVFYISGFTLLTLLINATTFQALYKALNLYPVTKFRREFFAKVMGDMESAYMRRVQKLDAHWLFVGTGAVDVANELVPSLINAEMDQTGQLVLHVTNPKTLSQPLRLTEWTGDNADEPTCIMETGSAIRDGGRTISETYRRLTGVNIYNMTEATSHASSMVLTRLGTIYSDMEMSCKISGSSLLALKNSIAVALDACYDEDSLVRPSPFVAEYNSLMDLLGHGESKKTHQRMPMANFQRSFEKLTTVVECIYAYVTAHCMVLGSTKDSKSGLVKMIGETYFNNILERISDAKAILRSLRASDVDAYHVAVTIMAAHLLITEKKEVVTQAGQSGTLLDDDIQKVNTVLENQHEVLLIFAPGKSRIV